MEWKSRSPPIRPKRAMAAAVVVVQVVATPEFWRPTTSMQGLSKSKVLPLMVKLPMIRPVG